jgi:site-specific DNA-methyltransferase (adenine-specific)/modification methylase
MSRVETGAGWTMHLGDCLEVMPTLAAVDALVTDPPYGIGLGTHGGAAAKPGKNRIVKSGYASHDDSPESFGAVAERITAAIAVAKRSAVFMFASSFAQLPRPDVLGGVYMPSACGRSRWGFTSLAPVLFYGSAPALNLGARATCITSTETAEKTEHPVPKPIGWMLWLVGLASLPNELVLDPFAGSGTTGVACLRLGRRFIGIEKEPKYFELACERLRAEERCLSLSAARSGQVSIFDVVGGKR